MHNNKDFEKVAICHVDAVYKAAVTLCNSTIEAEDLVQNTFLSAFEKFETFKEGSNCKAWLFKILRNKWIDQIRRNRLKGKTVSIEENIIAEPKQNPQTTWSNCEDLLDNFSDEQVIKALKIK